MSKQDVKEPEEAQVTLGRKEFQALHSAARAMFKESMKDMRLSVHIDHQQIRM
jgi:hypothetical protein